MIEDQRVRQREPAKPRAQTVAQFDGRERVNTCGHQRFILTHLAPYYRDHAGTHA